MNGKGSKGKIFENNIINSCKKLGIFCHRIKDTAMAYNQVAQFTQDNPYDFLIFKESILLALEAKHTKSTSFSIQRSEDDKNSKMIKLHQIESLIKASEYDGIKAGFLLSFENEKKESESTFYIDIENFMKFLKENDKVSINVIDIARYGGKRISQKKMRVNYTYGIDEIFKE